MGFLLSPKISIAEIDLTTVIPAVATTEGATVGLFRWGPLDKRVLVSSERDMLDRFLSPDATTYEHFLNCGNFLSYSNKLQLVRVAKMSQTEVALTNKLATSAASKVVTVTHTSHGLSTGAVITISGFTGTLDTNITASEINGRHTITKVDNNSYTFTVSTNSGAAGVTSAGGTITVGIGDFALNATAEKSLGSGLPGQGILIKNEEHYDTSFESGAGDVGPWAARFPGKAGNSLKVSICHSDAYSQTLAGTLSTKVSASGTITFAGQPSNNDTVVVNGKTYTFQASLTNVDGNVKIGASATATATNLFNAINATGGVSGTDYAAAMTANTDVVATNPTASTVVLTAIDPGTDGNALTLTESATNVTVSGATLSGGLDNSSTVTGTGTSFTTKLVVGSILVHPETGEEVKVAAIASNTSLTLDEEFSEALDASTVVAKWEFHADFGIAPGTSDFGTTHGCTNDEVHVIVLDEDGTFTGIRNQVLEKYSFVSLHSRARTLTADSNYYKTVINRTSKYIYWMDHLSVGTNWGSEDDNIVFTSVAKPYTYSLTGGLDGNSSAALADYERGFDFFSQPSDIDVSIVMTGPASATLQEYVVQNICETRKDCVATLSPPKAAVVNNAGNEATAILAHFATISASSYAIVDSGWGYQYDRYNDTYRWVPLNGDIAGLIARVDTERDPWFSPAGILHGHIKNKVKLAWNPNEAQRDLLYPHGINPVISKPGQGIVLWGDKTFLNRPSAFGHINVRRLFIVLEKAIATASERFLFAKNTVTTRAQMVNLIEPFLREVKARDGLTAFKVVCSASNNPPEVVARNELVVDIYILPTFSINYIKLNFIGTKNSSQFSEQVLGQTLSL